jgi:phosphatidate cytidylyltransferase
MAVSAAMTFLPRANNFDWRNFGVRAASGLVLASATLWAVLLFHGPPGLAGAPYLTMIAVAGALLSLEWSAMASPAHATRVALVTTFAVVAVVLLAYERRYAEAWICVVLGALFAGYLAKAAGARAVDAAYGVLYIAPAGLLMVWLVETRQGAGWTLMLFATTWAADIAAFLVGNLFKGPKLWPRFSPNKTWSGFVGGLCAAGLAAVCVAAERMRLSLPGAAAIGLIGGLATMAGDLWESILKRRFGVKDSGDLIPGHGGLLDRVDGLMFAVVAISGARLFVYLGWAH